MTNLNFVIIILKLYHHYFTKFNTTYTHDHQNITIAMSFSQFYKTWEFIVLRFPKKPFQWIGYLHTKDFYKKHNPLRWLVIKNCRSCYVFLVPPMLIGSPCQSKQLFDVANMQQGIWEYYKACWYKSPNARHTHTWFLLHEKNDIEKSWSQKKWRWQWLQHCKAM